MSDFFGAVTGRNPKSWRSQSDAAVLPRPRLENDHFRRPVAARNLGSSAEAIVRNAASALADLGSDRASARPEHGATDFVT
jgi:hypothetical protein